MLAFLLSCQVKRAVKVSLSLPVSSVSASKVSMVNNCTSLNEPKEAAIPAHNKKALPLLVLLFAAIPLLLIHTSQYQSGYFFVSTSFTGHIPLFLRHRKLLV